MANVNDLQRQVARQQQQLKAAHRELEKRDQVIRALKAGAESKVYERIPEISDLVDRMAALLFAAAPAPRAQQYDPYGGVNRTKGGKRDHPAPGDSTRWLRSKVRHYRNKIGSLVADLDDLLDPRAAEKKRNASDKPTCQNPDCPSEGKAGRFGARFCDRCGVPYPQVGDRQEPRYVVTDEDLERLKRAAYANDDTPVSDAPGRPERDS